MHSVTLVPLPSWRGMLKAAFSYAVPDDALAAPWCRPGESAVWFSRSSWSLAIVARCQQLLLSKQAVTVWVPDFFCNSSLAPLREFGVKLVFYPITEQMAPDLAACYVLADQQPMDLFLLVHYFGQPTPAELVASFCEKHGAWLIEDAAHVLQPITGVGQTGDFVLYSPHKHLPIPDGAVVVVRPNGPAQLTNNGLALKVLTAVRSTMLNAPGSSKQPAAIWLLKRLAQRLGLRARPSTTAFNAVVEPCLAAHAHPRMSTLSRRLLAPLLPQLQMTATRRNRTAQYWCDVLAFASTDAPVTPHLTKSTPYLASFSARDSHVTEALYARFQQVGLPVTTWPDLPPEVLTHPGEHPAATALRRNRFYLPVHQTLSRQQLLACGKSLLDAATLHWQARALSHSEWEAHWSRCSKTNLLQCWQYGEAKKQAEGWKVLRFLILDNGKQPIALAQVLTRGLPLVGRIARLNRGPLLLTEQTAETEVPLKLAALRVLMRETRRQGWWMLQAAPELLDAEHAVSGLQSLGLRRLTAPAWASGRISLHTTEQSLLMGLNGKWRNCMRKGEKLGVTVTAHQCQGDMLELLIQSYSDLKTNRKFDGMSEQLIRALSAQQGPRWQINLFVASEEAPAKFDNPLGMLITIHSGDTALYLIGSTNDKGRQMQASSVLLWRAILHAKHNTCSWFDIGGLSELTPKGIAEFKQGLNAMPYRLIGEWRKWF